MGKRYVAAPPVPSAVLPRYKVVLEVLSGALTVSAGARRLGLSRNHFQTLMHRGLTGLLEALENKPAGRRGPGPREKELLEEKARMQREIDRLVRQAETTDRLLGIAKGFLKGQRRIRTRRASGKGRETTEGG